LFGSPTVNDQRKGSGARGFSIGDSVRNSKTLVGSCRLP